MRAKKYVDGFNQLSYSERLQRLDLPMLAHRRKHRDKIEVFKPSTTYDKAALSTAMKFSNRLSGTHDRKILRLEVTDGVRASRETPSTIEYQQRGMISRDMLLSRRRYSKSDWMLIGGMTTADSFLIQDHITMRDTMNKCDKLVEVDRTTVCEL